MVQYNELLNEIAKFRKFSGNTEVVPIFVLSNRFLWKHITVFRTDSTGSLCDSDFSVALLFFMYPIL